jgi:hypothetical protein
MKNNNLINILFISQCIYFDTQTFILLMMCYKLILIPLNSNVRDSFLSCVSSSSYNNICVAGLRGNKNKHVFLQLLMAIIFIYLPTIAVLLYTRTAYAQTVYFCTVLFYPHRIFMIVLDTNYFSYVQNPVYLFFFFMR